jgi:ribose-phosphate pyrophosphokinase
MKYLNLTEGFNPYNAKENECIKFESFIFSGGEPHIKLESNLDDNNFPKSLFGVIKITIRLNSFNDLGFLSVAVNAIRRSYQFEALNLFTPYFPGARQDRVCNEGEALTVKVYTDIINSMKFDLVTIFDPHSDVAPALINNCTIINNHSFAQLVQYDIMSQDKCISDFVYISPDAGSNKKMFDLMQKLDPNGLCKTVYCDKKRDVKTGKLSGFKVNNILGFDGENCIIFDDICDGGGTFIGLAKELKKLGAGDIYLVVSHGIFSKPLQLLKPYFKKIYTTDSWRSKFNWERVERECTDLVNIIKFNKFL